MAKSSELKGERKFELGNTVSYITLQRFFEDNNRQEVIHDLRFLKTLDKLSIFLGFKDLNEFIQKSNIKELDNPKTEIEEDFEFFKKIIVDYSIAEFESLKLLPVSNIDGLKRNIFEGSPLLERISTYSKLYEKKKYRLITENNRSNYEIYGYKIVSQDENMIVIKTDEFWNLAFEKIDTEEKLIFNKLNSQIYFIKKINGIWKIWDNYNPDAGDIIKNIEGKKSP